MKIEDFWNEKHAEKNLSSLSGHPGLCVLKGLYIEDYAKTCHEVLEVGVGLGICTHDIAAMGKKISVVDISPIALARVADVTKQAFLMENIERLPSNYFDLAISYCVTQHINNASLKRHLSEVIRSLTPSGIFAMQYAFPVDGNTYIETPECLAGGGVCRKPEDMYRMVEAAGGKIIYHRIWGCFPQYKSGWAIVHIQKQGSE